jgi:hypothetical protein
MLKKASILTRPSLARGSTAFVPSSGRGELAEVRDAPFTKLRSRIIPSPYSSPPTGGEEKGEGARLLRPRREAFLTILLVTVPTSRE